MIDGEGALDLLEAFERGHGARFCGIRPNRGTVTLTRREQSAPSRIDVEGGGARVPFLASEMLVMRCERSREAAVAVMATRRRGEPRAAALAAVVSAIASRPPAVDHAGGDSAPAPAFARRNCESANA